MAVDRGNVLALILSISIIATVWAETTCPDKTFGWKCKFKCNCKDDAKCDPVTGACKNGCKNDNYGQHCLLMNFFRYDELGSYYTGTFNMTLKANKCLPWTDKILNRLYRFKASDFADGFVPGGVCRYPENSRAVGLVVSNKITEPWCFNKKYVVERCAVSLGVCVRGRYGDNCMSECHCKNVADDCNKKTGYCDEGCHAGWTGVVGCQYHCSAGKFGDNCQKDCGNCRNKAVCHFETGECRGGLCAAGYKGITCKQVCDLNTYGENCIHQCGECEVAAGESCDKFTGSCPSTCKPGYQGAKCDEDCSAGKFGDNCQKDCGNCRNKAVCHFETGECRGGLCAAGYKGITCKQVCDLNTYGENCIHHCGECEVAAGESCDKFTGSCPSTCKPGYQGAKCDEECEKGRFGLNCSGICGYCKNGAPCNKVSGVCENGCADGYRGDICINRQAGGGSDATVGAVAGVSSLVILIAVIVFVVCLILRRRKFKKTEVNANHKKGRKNKKGDTSDSTDEKDKMLVPENGGTASDVENQNGEEATETIYVNVNPKKQSMPVKIEDLADYLKNNKQNDCEGFKTEFSGLPHGHMALCETAKKPENRPKNRYRHFIAYDYSRVILETIDSEPGSDYINANYIDGYNRPTAYIASQDPTKVTTRDFWRMIWQEKVCKIVMLTNIMEACKKKCERYWPYSSITKYGSITVENVDSLVFTDFTIRTFRVVQNKASRIVKQFHFTSWLDHGALPYPSPLLTFKRKVQMYLPESTTPVVVHCSAGIGRSGTYIALDYLLHQAKAEGLVDVLRCAQLMRANRINMIQTWEQYVFVYEALLEALKAGETTITQSAFRTIYEDYTTVLDQNETPLQKQFAVLQSITHSMDSEEFKAALLPENLSKNRVKNVLPANRCRPRLYTQVEGCNDYINAIFLPGYTRRDAFIVTQMPLPNTVADFWRMLYDHNSHTVVMLNDFDRNDKTCALYWPEEYNYTVEYNPISIELLSSTEHDPNVSVRVFKLCNNLKGEERTVKHFQLKSWPDYQKVPNSTSSLLQLYENVQEWIKQNGDEPVTVHCMNGASKSGLYCGVSMLFERMQRDHEVDVFQTAMTIRTNRPQFIEDLEQYQFCYQMVLEALNQKG